MRKGIVIFSIILVFLCFIPIYALEAVNGNAFMVSKNDSLTEDEISRIELWIEKNMKDGKIPGTSIVIIKGDKTVYKKGFGYADLKAKRPVTSETLFELGSNSKAFTALALLQLEEKGLVNLNDPVKKYLPWFKMKYVGEYEGKKINDYVDITLRQLLHQTSGIPFKSIADIPVSEDADSLEKTVRTQVGKELDFYPGEKFQYATINYDVLGLVIQEASGLSYESYMKDNVLNALDMKSTYLFRNEVPGNNMAKGYKYGFLRADEYEAPIYRGNTPAGYIITCANDIEKWLNYQIENYIPVNIERTLIDKAHQPDRSVPPANDGSSYAAGWTILQRGSGEIIHGGSNPNFTSYIITRPADKIAVAVLSNMNTSYTDVMGKGIMDILVKREIAESPSNDIYKSIDNCSSTISIIAFLFTLFTLSYLGILILQIIKKIRVYQGKALRNLRKIANFLLLFLGLLYCIYRMPQVLFWGLNWDFVKVWAPKSFIAAIIGICTSTFVFGIYYFLISIFPKPNDNNIFHISILSILSGFGNAFIIFIINEAIYREDCFESGLFLYFIAGIILYICGQKIVRTKLVTLANELVYDKRVGLIKGILNSTFQKFESIESSKILAGLNNDTESISNFINIIIAGVTNLITLICCFVYMGIINFYGLLVSIVLIFCAAGLYFVMGRTTRKIWEHTRDIQNVFFKFINDMINGFKELSINNAKKIEFKEDMVRSCDEYKTKRIIADMNFANVFIIGELLFTFVIGFIAFVFPLLFEHLQNDTLRNYIFVLLYMSGPLHGVLNAIPEIMRVRVSWKRINELQGSIASNEYNSRALVNEIKNTSSFKIELKDVVYEYNNDKSEKFSLGPLNIDFYSGEITFITGGNGSGKSTLAKIITGLYVPHKGEILINGCKVDNAALGQYYSAIFSDYYLFDKLYGIEYGEKKDEIRKYMKVLQIEDKLSIDNGVFSTIKLSTGQRKRLALLIAYLENRSIYLFDEWAADQDPEFRSFFYNILLPELKKRGKCIIAITHDDRYFDIADNIIKLERGKIIAQKHEELLVGRI